MRSVAHHESGFTATIAVVAVSLGTIALALVAVAAVAQYADSVDREETRIQAGLNQKACDDSAALIRAKDAFAHGTLLIPELDCSVTL